MSLRDPGPEHRFVSDDRSSRGDAGAPSPADQGRPQASGSSSSYGVGYGYGQHGGESHLLDYARVLHKRRWTAVTAFLLVFMSVTVYTFTTTPLYSARAQVLIENENPNVVKFEEVVDLNKSTVDYYQTQYRILQSRVLARRTIDGESLWDHPLLARRPGAMAWLRSFFEASGAATPEGAETTEQSRVIDNFMRLLVITPIRNSRLVDVSFVTAEAGLSARLANAHAKRYIEQNLEFKFLATKEATDFLSERASEQRKALESSEQALQQYREQTGAVSLEDRQNIVVQRLADLNAAVTRARTERIARESAYNQIHTLEKSGTAVDTLPAILNNAFIQQLKGQLNELQQQRAQMAEKLGSRHPDMIKVQSAIDSTEKRVAAEVQKVVSGLRNDYQAAVANEQSLQRSLDQQRAEALDLNRASIQYNVLQRDAASNQSMFTGLLERSRETGISGELKTSNIRVVDPAETPRRPSSPNKTTNLTLAFFGGAFLGLGLAFFFEYLDNRIKLPEEIKDHLGLPFLGMVPLFTAQETAGPPLLGSGMPLEFAEAFRGIRTSILFSTTDVGPKSLVITSTGPGEGKSVVSANMAISFAMAGQRVLLVDADMRRPKSHEFFGTSLEPGLSNVMVGDAKVSEAISRTVTPNLWFLPAGKNPPNPAELLGSKRFKDFTNKLGEHFEWIIIDSPPVMAVTDANVIAHSATGVVFVVGAEMTSRGAAKSALDHLDQVKAKYVGGILNRVDVRGNPYYYSRHYRKEYQAYYTRA